MSKVSFVLFFLSFIFVLDYILFIFLSCNLATMYDVLSPVFGWSYVIINAIYNNMYYFKFYFEQSVLFFILK